MKARLRRRRIDHEPAPPRRLVGRVAYVSQNREWILVDADGVAYYALTRKREDLGIGVLVSFDSHPPERPRTRPRARALRLELGRE